MFRQQNNILQGFLVCIDPVWHSLLLLHEKVMNINVVALVVMMIMIEIFIRSARCDLNSFENQLQRCEFMIIEFSRDL
jgi:hypothetical protein